MTEEANDVSIPVDLYERIREYILDRTIMDSRASKLAATLAKLEVKREEEQNAAD
jgi:hypothetical protein